MKFWQRAQSAGFKIPELPIESLKRTFPNTDCIALDGKLVASHIFAQCKELGKDRKQPKLAAMLAGEDPASQVYVASKRKSFANVGFASDTITIPSREATSTKLIEIIDRLNSDASVSGILLQLPLPNKIDETLVTARIKREKDVDGFLSANMGLLAIGQFKETFLPCTPFGIMVLLAAYGIDPAGKKMVVVGRSNIVGKPMALLGISADSTVTVAHSRTKNLPEVCRDADILIAAVGKRALITKEFVKPGAVVIDVGIHRDENGKLSGDVAFDVRDVASALTPVPGGVGPLTIAMLTVNTALAAWN